MAQAVGGSSVKTTVSAHRGVCSGAFHCTSMDTHTGERNGHLVRLVQTGQRGLPFMFLFCRASSFSWSFSFMHFERALVKMSDALPPRTVSARDMMFILPWFLVAWRANSSNVSASPPRLGAEELRWVCFGMQLSVPLV